MDLSGPQALNNILQPDELKLVPEDIQQKLSAYINNFSDEYCKNRAAANRLGFGIYFWIVVYSYYVEVRDPEDVLEV
ncbi:GD10819 [Drosophila simulans]|uniref:GD10819 n=1 Tax=Drosophila simulans TaxID=7240 RepID=B4QBQ3_DROSI|nr:GD10819 [Drosophila simulans]